ncbi:MAG: pseudouridine synthase [Clostridia bacterium]|nr:pseudouridine synthase [Clostridia bacterium]
MNKCRLDRFVSNQTSLSRSEAIKEIKRGKVAVDNKTVKDPSFSIDTDTSFVTLSGEEIKYKKHIYLIMNKPSGVLTATRDKGVKTVIDLVPEKYRRKDLSPAGRLDKDTTGLLILTDDGAFVHNIISPKKMVPKVYEAELIKDINDEDVKAFFDGIVLSDGTTCLSATLKKAGDKKAKVKIYEGKYHQVKRMFAARGNKVLALKRVSIGLLKLPENLMPGDIKEVSFDDLLRKTINYKQK